MIITLQLHPPNNTVGWEGKFWFLRILKDYYYNQFRSGKNENDFFLCWRFVDFPLFWEVWRCTINNFVDYSQLFFPNNLSGWGVNWLKLYEDDTNGMEHLRRIASPVLSNREKMFTSISFTGLNIYFHLRKVKKEVKSTFLNKNRANDH